MQVKRKLMNSIRAVNSLLMILIGIVVAASSVYLYVAPYDAAFRNVWDNLHTLFGFVLIGTFLLHVPMNWRPIRSYLRTKTKHFVRPRAEGMAALTIFVILALSGVAYPVWSQTMSPDLTAGKVSPSIVAFDPYAAASVEEAAPVVAGGETVSVASGTKLTYVPADTTSCSNCPALKDGGCHSGLVFDFKGTVYYGSASGVSYVQKVVEIAQTPVSENDKQAIYDSVAAAVAEPGVPDGINPNAATQTGETQIASVEPSGGKGRNHQ